MRSLHGLVIMALSEPLPGHYNGGLPSSPTQGPPLSALSILPRESTTPGAPPPLLMLPAHANEIQYYSEHVRALAYSQVHKAEKFLEFDCLKWNPDAKVWLCAPIPGYNKTTHEIKKEGGAFVCSCQGCQTRIRKGNSPNCSHIGALYIKFERRNQARGFGPYRQQALNEEMEGL
jgi:hypothetical protein